jgi:benzoylformate decarboxylase
VTAADWLLAHLADAGVEVIFGNPGSTELPLMDAFPRQDRVTYILGLHEAAVMGMADGYAQQGNRLAVVNVHVQPGLANAMSGILNAARARVPVLVTVGQQVTGLLDSAPFLGGELVAMAAPIAKGAWQVDSVEALAHVMQTAMRTALAHPRGPVVVALPMDVLVAPAPRSQPALPLSPTDPGAVTAAVERLMAAARPAIVAGDGVVAEDAVDALLGIAERLGAPIYGEPFAARAPVPTRHPLWAGALPGFAAQIAPRLAGYDVVLAVGMPVFRLFGASEGSALPVGVSLVHLDVDPAEIGRVYPPECGLAMSVAEGLGAILRGLPAADAAVELRRATTAASIADAAGRARVALAEASEGPRVSPARLCRAIAAAIEPEDLVVDEALTSGRWLRTALHARNTPHNWLAHRGSALGWGLPAAVGARMADPGRRVMCLHGDGSFLFGVHALWTAANQGVQVAVVVADNGGYEILRAGLEGLTGRPHGSWPGLAIAEPVIDLVELSRAFGATAERVESADALDAGLADLWRRADDGPAVLVVPVSGRTPAVGYPVTL